MKFENLNTAGINFKMIINVVIVVALATLQGIAEFIPISSSGHIMLAKHFLDFKGDNLYYVVVLHAGTLFSIIYFYHREVYRFFRWENRKITFLLIVATIPLVMVGFFFKPLMGKLFDTMFWIVPGFLTTSICLIFLHNPNPGKRFLGDMKWYEALLIGTVQCFAVIPGLSRSGSTISMATRLGFVHESAAKFSFFLALPAIFGAVLLKSITIIEFGIRNFHTLNFSVLYSIIGFYTSFTIGYFSLKTFLKILNTNKLKYFGYYCATIAILIFVFSIKKPENLIRFLELF